MNLVMIKLFMPYAINKGADQPARLCSLISTFVIHCLKSCCIWNSKTLVSFCSWVLSDATPGRQVFLWHCSNITFFKRDMSRLMAKPTKWHVGPAKTQISLGICPVWSVFAVHSMGSYGPKLSSCRQRKLWSDWVNAQTDLSFRWAQMPFYWFWHEVAHMQL